MDLSLLIVNIIAGALVGYITKTLAINMLFKRYPVIGGAEIIKDRENLALSISELVEERLIKPSTMLEEFQKEEFKVSFESLINHIIENTINQNISNLDTISEISGIHQTSDNLHNFLIQNRERILQPCIDALFNNVFVKDVLTQEQLKNLIEKLLVIFSNSFIKNLEPIINNFFEEMGKKYINEFISGELLLKVADNLVIENIHQLLHEKFEKQLDNYFDELYQLLDIDNILEKIEISLKNKTFFQLIGENDNNKGIENLIEHLKSFLNSEKGKIILNDFLGHIIAILKNVDIPIASLLTGEIEEKILLFMEKHLPDLIISIEMWIALNKVEMETMINNAVEEHLESENLIKQIIGTIFVQKLAERYQIVEGTLEELKKLAQKTGPNLINLINRFLENTRISDLIRYIETNFLDRDALLGVITELVNKFLPKLNLSVFNKIFHKRLADFSFINEIKLNKLFKEHFYVFIKLQAQEKFLFNPKLNSFLKSMVKTELEKISTQPLEYLLPDKENPAFKKAILDFISSETFQSAVINKITEEVPKLVQDKTINQMISENIKFDLYGKLASLYNSKIDIYLQILKKEKVSSLYKRTAKIYADLCKNKFFSKQITDTLVNLMVQLIRENSLLDRKIFIAVKESFGKFTDDELKDEMNSFMGNELRPIKLLGAFLGAVVGIVMYYISFIPGYGDYAKGYWALLSYPMSYAITEVGTNWLAIKMLFKPYEPRKIPFTNINFPFTPGVFPKNKKALAESMVNFIDKKLLSKDNMVKILEKYHYRWKEVISEVVSKNNYQIIESTINKYTRDNYDTVSPVILDLGFAEINKNKDEIVNYLIDEAKNINLADIDLSGIKAEISLKIDGSNTNLKNVMINELFNNQLNFGKTLNQLLPDYIFKEINSFISKTIKEVSGNISDVISDTTAFEKFIHSLSEKADNLLENKLEDLVEGDIINGTKTKLINYVEQILKNKEAQDKVLNYLENRYFDKGISSEKELGEIFEGKLISTVLKESDVIMDSFSIYLLNISKNKKEDLVKIILSDIEKKGIFESMLVIFGGVRKDVRGIVDVIVDTKLESYLENKKTELKHLFTVYVKTYISKIKLYELGLTEEVFDINNIKNILKKNLLNNQKIFDILNELLGSISDDILKNFSLKEIMATVNLHSPNDLVKRFDDEITILRNDLSIRLKDNDNRLTLSTIALSTEIFDKTIYEIPLNLLLKDVSNTEITNCIETITDTIYTSGTFKIMKENLLDDFFINLNGNISEILDYNILQQDLINMLHNLTERNNQEQSRSLNFQMDIINSVKDITINFVEVLNENVEQETKQVIENILVNSLVDSLRINNREVLNPIKFDEIVRNEVYMMNSARIESMFAFAKPIFRLLIWYGALGGIIGLAVGIFEAFR